MVEAESWDNRFLCATLLRFIFCNPAERVHSATLQTPRLARSGQPDMCTKSRYARARRLPQKILPLWLSLNPQHFPLYAGQSAKDALAVPRGALKLYTVGYTRERRYASCTSKRLYATGQVERCTCMTVK